MPTPPRSITITRSVERDKVICVERVRGPVLATIHEGESSYVDQTIDLVDTSGKSEQVEPMEVSETQPAADAIESVPVTITETHEEETLNRVEPTLDPLDATPAPSEPAPVEVTEESVDLLASSPLHIHETPLFDPLPYFEDETPLPKRTYQQMRHHRTQPLLQSF